MPIVSNGDFSDGLNGWTTVGAGETAPTYDAANGWVVFGNGNNDVQDGDRLSQQVALVSGQTYTLTFSIRELGSGFGGFGVTVDLEDTMGSSGFTTIGSATVANDQTELVTITFTSPYDDPILRIRGQYGFGGTESVLIFDDIAISCFTRGTMIETPRGPVPVEELAVDDEVLTVDEGAQPILWIGSKQLCAAEVAHRPDFAPVVIPKDAFGATLPERDLRVSPAHRVVVSGPMVELATGVPEGFVPAKQLVGLVKGVDTDVEAKNKGVEYFHILFDKHQVVWSDGLPTESFHPAKRTISGYDEDARNEILHLFPELATLERTSIPLARPLLKRHEACVSLYQN